MPRANLIISIVLISFSGFYAYLITGLPKRNLPNTLGADFMPWVLTICLLLLSVLLLVQSLLKRSAEEEADKISPQQILGMAVLFVIFVAYIVLMNMVGYLVVTPFFIFAMMVISGSRRWAEMVISSVVVTAFVYLVFQFVFRVQLPRVIFL
jgi:putative tricarboxylic transport membrane protein